MVRLSMEKRYRLDIENPCTQKWASLEETANGRYCASCDHQVIDFTSWPEDKILAYLGQASGKVCGRLLPGQCHPFPEPSRKQASLLRSSLLLVAGTLSLAPTDFLWAKNKAAIKIVAAQSGDKNLNDKPPIAPATPIHTVITVRGRLVSKEKAEPMPGGTVLLLGTNIGTSADANGLFNLQIPRLQQNQVKISFAMVGFETFYKVVSLEKEIIDLGTIALPESKALLGEVVIIPSPSPSLWQRLLNTFKSK